MDAVLVAGGLGTVKRRNGSKHDKTGCLTCRYRHKKCIENTFPRCGECRRLNLECVYDHPRQVLPPQGNARRRELAQRLAPVADPSTDGQLLLFPDWVSQSRRRGAMSHYIGNLSGLLTVSRGHNSFLNHFVPMAMESPALSEAIVAYSSAHLAAVRPEYSVMALQARFKALSLLLGSLACSSPGLMASETMAATCLVLLTSEVCTGNNATWYSHLTGAKHIITSALAGRSGSRGSFDAFKLSSDGCWILRNFAYHDVIASVTLGTKPLIRGPYLDGITDLVDTYLGVAAGLLMSISRISCLEVADVDFEGPSIEQTLRDWRCPQGVLLPLRAVAHAYRSASLIYLYRRVSKLADSPVLATRENGRYGSQVLQDKIQAEAAATLDHIAGIPAGDVSEAPLLFPLFIAGAELKDPAQVDAVRARLASLFSNRRFDNISRTTGVLAIVWRLRGEGLDADWEDTKTHREGPLLLA